MEAFAVLMAVSFSLLAGGGGWLVYLVTHKKQVPYAIGERERKYRELEEWRAGEIESARSPDQLDQITASYDEKFAAIGKHK